MTNPKIVVEATGDFRRLNGDITKTEGLLGKFGRTAGRGAAIGLGLAGAAVVKLGIDSVKAASLSQQSIGATESVFGKYADTVIDRSNEAAEAVGLSANEYRELANVTGAMLSSAGTPLKKVTELTDKLNVRAADMAATFGGETSEAVQSISSLLRGETDPIERYGVAIKQSDISARLAAQGLEDLEGKAKKQAEQQARLRLLFQQTGKAAGQFAEESDTLAGAQARLGAKFEDVKAKAGTILLPALTELAGVGSDALDELVEHGDDLKGMWDDIRGAVAPAVDEIVEALGNLFDEGDGLASMWEDRFIPALELTAEVVGAVVNFVDELPGPVKSLAAEAGLAAIALGLLQTGATKATGALSGLVGPAATAATRLAALQSAAKTAAGVGGLLALTKSANEADEATGDILDVLGGAGIGFAVGGPWGAAVGAVAGLTKALLDGDDQADRYRESVEQARARVDALRDSLDQATGAMTANTRATALARLEEEGAIDAANRLGVSQRDLVSAALGNEAATMRVKRAYDQTFTGGNVVAINGQLVSLGGNTSALTADSDLLANSIGDVSRELNKATKEERQAIRASQDLSGKLGGLQKNSKVKIFVQEHGIPVTVRGLANLANRFKGLNNKQLRILIKAADLPYTVRQIRDLQGELETTGRQNPKPKVDVDDRRIKEALRIHNAGLTDLGRRKESPKVDLELSGFKSDRAYVLSQLTGIPDEHVNVWIHRREAGTSSSGSSLPVPSRAVSPSGLPELGDEIEELGRVVAGKAEKAGRDIITRLLRGITGGKAEVQSALGRLTSFIEKRINLKDDKKERAREKRVLKALKDEYAALTKIGKLQDRLNRQLEEARAHLEEVRGWVDQVRDSFVETGNVTKLGIIGSGVRVSSTLLLDQLRDEVADARRFAELIRELTDDQGVKLNETSLAQLLAAGPEAGLATAEALAAGGDAALAELNSLTSELTGIGESLGSDMSDVMFDVGLQAAIGIVEGLEAQDEALDRAARRLARKLARAVRNALNGLGNEHRGGNNRSDEVMRGLTLGIDETAAHTHGRQLAAAMLRGFGTPTLGANLKSTGSAPIVSVKITAEQMSQLERGKALTLDVSAAGARGVRQVAIQG